ncbi:hypothetical protein HK102_002621 [Quaeritorhiza haematococci]|nr:hypothetical protein HK102_002621 [Quaeritorhiza haematococci]
MKSQAVVALLASFAVAASAQPRPVETVTVNVGQGGLVFAPADITVGVGSTVNFVLSSGNHNVRSQDAPGACAPNGLFSSPPQLTADAPFTFTFSTPGVFHYFCGVAQHCQNGMQGVVRVAAADGTIPVGPVGNGTAAPSGSAALPGATALPGAATAVATATAALPTLATPPPRTSTSLPPPTPRPTASATPTNAASSNVAAAFTGPLALVAAALALFA